MPTALHFALSVASLLLVACGSADARTEPDAATPATDSGPQRPPDPLRMRIELPPLDCSRENCFQVVLLSDPHVIDEWYTGPENGELDTASILAANERLVGARDRIHALDMPIARAFVLGDVIHEYNSLDPMFYYEPSNLTAHDIVADVLETFEMPVHLALGNHDYFVPEMPREFVHELFRDKLGLERTYYSVDHRGFRFIVLDSQLGDTWDAASARFDTHYGSFGEAQLRWLDEQLAEGLPSFVMFHHHPLVLAEGELDDADFADIHAVLGRHENVLVALSGHLHRWFNHQRRYGSWHVTLGSTRYDEDAFWVIRCDTESGEFDLLNPDTAVWGSVDSLPYPR